MGQRVIVVRNLFLNIVRREFCYIMNNIAEHYFNSGIFKANIIAKGFGERRAVIIIPIKSEISLFCGKHDDSIDWGFHTEQLRCPHLIITFRTTSIQKYQFSLSIGFINPGDNLWPVHTRVFV